MHWNISSPGWAKHAWSSFFAPWNAGAAIFAFNYERFEAKRVLDALVTHRVTTLCAPPTVWRMLILEDLRAWRTSLREIVGAGEPLNPEVIDRVRAAWGITIRDGYGQTETTAMFGNSPRQEVKPGSMGRPLPGYAVALLDPDGTPSDDGEIVVELAPAPAGLMAGYLDTPMPVVEAGGRRYYRTFDMASRDRDGYYWFIGRVDDVFKSSDYRISPFELESALIEHEAVAEAAVVPSPDALRLAVPKAFIVLKAGHPPAVETARSIFSFCRERLAPYKRVRRIEFCDLPKTISGKIRRVQLRAAEHRDSRVKARDRVLGGGCVDRGLRHSPGSAWPAPTRTLSAGSELFSPTPSSNRHNRQARAQQQHRRWFGHGCRCGFEPVLKALGQQVEEIVLAADSTEARRRGARSDQLSRKHRLDVLIRICKRDQQARKLEG